MNNIEYCTIFSPLEWRWGKSRLIKKCCNNPHGVPVLAPQHQLSEKELRELDKGVLKIFYERILLTEILSATIVYGICMVNHIGLATLFQIDQATFMCRQLTN